MNKKERKTEKKEKKDKFHSVYLVQLDGNQKREGADLTVGII